MATRHWTTSRRPSPWVLAFVAVLPLVFAAMGYRSLRRQQLLDAEGITTTGTVVDRRHTSGKGSSSKLTYAYRVDDRAYQATCYVAYSTYRRVQMGERIPVTYARSDPGVPRCPGSTENRQGWALLCCAFALLAVTAIVFAKTRPARVRVSVTVRQTVRIVDGAPNAAGSEPTILADAIRDSPKAVPPT